MGMSNVLQSLGNYGEDLEGISRSYGTIMENLGRPIRGRVPLAPSTGAVDRVAPMIVRPPRENRRGKDRQTMLWVAAGGVALVVLLVALRRR